MSIPLFLVRFWRWIVASIFRPSADATADAAVDALAGIQKWLPPRPFCKNCAGKGWYKVVWSNGKEAGWIERCACVKMASPA